MKRTKRPTEQELLHQWLEGDLDLTQQLYVEKDEPQPEAVEPYQPKRDRDTFLRSLRRSLRLYNVLAFLLCAVFAALMLMTVANLPRYGSADAPTVNEVAQRYVEQGTKETGAVNTVAGMILDYRAFDTLGESFVLFTAVCAVTILMNLSPKKRRPLPKEVVNYAADPIVAGVCRGLIPVILLFGVYILLNGHLSPGGGFSGGAVLAAGLMIYKTIKVGEVFNPLAGVTATDAEDGDITAKIEVVENMVDINSIGKYSVTLEVVDSAGLKSSKSINVKVDKAAVEVNKAPKISASNKVIKSESKFNPYSGVTATDYSSQTVVC